VRAGIAFGSNMGDRLRHLVEARERVLASRWIDAPVLASGVYLTSPLDCPPGSGPFYNAVLEVELAGEPEDLMHELRACELQLGRLQEAPRNVPRTIDLDLLYAGNLELRTGTLIVPHPRIAQRRFVLEPLAEIRPELVLPGYTETVAELLAKLPLGDSVERLEDEW
jgi:2-amino-4-hydroxy-6-hydroxymethyldihydropteridine diphosphokinase